MDTAVQTYELPADLTGVKHPYRTTRPRKWISLVLPTRVPAQKPEEYSPNKMQIAIIDRTYVGGKDAEATKSFPKRFDMIVISFLYLAGLSGLIIGLITSEIYYPIVGILGSIVASLHLYGLKEKIESWD